MIAANPQKRHCCRFKTGTILCKLSHFVTKLQLQSDNEQKKEKKGQVNLKFSKKKRLNGDHVKTEK